MININLHDGEKIVAKVRKHWLVFVLESFGLFIVALFPLGLLALPPQFMTDALPTLTGGQIGALVTFIVVAWELILFTVLMSLVTTYYLDVIIVTNKRILDVDQVGLFVRDVAGLPIEKLEDIKIRTTGILAEVFRFGRLDIQTAGDQKEVSVRAIRHPERVRDLIMEAYHMDKHDPQ